VNEEKRIHIYRIVQELINNIIKHSRANVVELSLKIVENRVQLRVKDDGVGFDRNVILKENKGDGLQNIIARAELLNAKVYLSTKRGHGVNYLIEIPL